MNRKRVVIVTGSTGGLGAHVTDALAAKGWDLILVNRPSRRAEEQAETLASRWPESRVHGISANLLEIEEVLGAVNTVRSEYERIDALYNIAGVLTADRMNSSAGHESHFAINTLASYALATRLRPVLSSAGGPDDPALVVNLSSSAIKSVRKLDAAALPNPKHIGKLMGAYAESKFALTAVTALLGPSFLDDHIVMVAVDPGPMRTSMTTKNAGMPVFLRPLVPLLFRRPESVAPRLIETAERARADRAAGVLISGGKRVRIPPAASDPLLQKSIAELLEACIPEHAG
ncbi:MAG: SDR family NAD(P)-dependent oxidoreductase [Planctomycetota bacterium]